MPPNNQGNNPNDWPTMAQSFNIVYVLCNVHATCITVFTRTAFGAEALGFPGLYACIMIVLVGAFGHAPEMHYYLGVWLVFLVIQWAMTAKLVRQGLVFHTRHPGDPILAMVFTKNVKIALRFVEPVLCLVAAAILRLESEVLGMFVGWGFLSLSLRNGIDSHINRQRVRELQNAQLEQSWLAEQYRQQNGSH